MNYQPVTAGNQTNPSAGFQDKFDAEKAREEIDQQYVLFPVWSSDSTNPHNYDGDAAFDGKEHDFHAKKPESKVSVSPSSSALLRKQDDKTKKEAKGKSHVESFTGYRDLSAEFEDYSDNNINEVNAAGTIVPTIGKNSPNSTNTFSASGPSNTADITYSDDEDDVGAEADFNNLETSITASLIPTIKVRKDHPVSQIISKAKKDGIFIIQDKYVDEILRKFRLTKGKSASTPINTEKPLLKDPDGEDVDVHIYRSMIGSLMYLTLSRLDIMFAVNNVTRLQALVDKKKVVITEAIIRDTLRLDDAEGVDYLPNEEIFIELARMGYEKPSTKLTFYKAFFLSQWKFLIHTILQCMSAKRTSRNEFSSSMASAVICLSTGFFGVETPLFEGMLVEQEIKEEGDANEHVEEVTAGDAAHGDDSAAHEEVPTVTEESSIPSPTPPTPPPPPQDLPSTSQVQQTPPQSPQVQPPSPQPQPQPQQAADFPMSRLQEALDACVALTKRVEHLEYDKVAQALEITKLKKRVKKLDKRNKVRVLKLRRMIAEMDKDDVVVLIDDKEEDKKVEEDKVVESAQVQGRQAESQAEIYKIDMDHANKVLSMQE
nr:hypothetical protein [Tanacetum cinerariifolium]